MKLRLFFAALFLSGAASAHLEVDTTGVGTIYNATFETMPIGGPLDSDHTGVANDRPNTVDNNLTAVVVDRSLVEGPTVTNTKFVRMTESCGEAPDMAWDRAISLGKPTTSPTAIAHVAIDVLFENRENYHVLFRNGIDSGIPGPASQSIADININADGTMVLNSMGGQSRIPWAVGVTIHIDAFFDTGKNVWYAFVDGERVVNGTATLDSPIGLVAVGFQHTRFCEDPGQGGFSGAMQLDNFVFQQVAGIPDVVAAPEVSSILAGLGRPFDVAIHGGYAYVADPSTHTVWKVNLSNAADKTPVAGIGWKTDVDPGDRQGFNGDGIDATQAQLDNPSGVAIDPAGTGTLYIADTGNHAVRKVALGIPGALITTAAGIPTSYGVVDAAGFAACGNQCPATSLQLFGPRSLAVDFDGNLYIADRMNQQVKRVNKATGFIFVVAGVAGETGGNDGPVGGPAFCAPGDDLCTPAAKLNSPTGIAVDLKGIVYVADEGNNRIRRVIGGSVTTVLAGALVRPTGVAVDSSMALFIADYGNHRIRRAANCNSDGCQVDTIAGTGTPGSSGTPGGPATAVQLNSPIGVTLDGDILYISDMVNGRVVAVDVTP